MLVCHWHDYATKYAVVGYDINHARVAALQSGSDSTFEVDEVTRQV
jgi:UDP-N-acetyl-D-galactosamine dehydrogenase